MFSFKFQNTASTENFCISATVFSFNTIIPEYLQNVKLSKNFIKCERTSKVVFKKYSNLLKPTSTPKVAI